MDEKIGLVLVFMRDNEGMTKMHSIRRQSSKREDISDLRSDMSRNIFTKENGRFLHVWSLTRLITKVV
jgi:hypothetical protein